ncbi:MAG: hypothetical protein WAN74_07875 [Thermoplasmata archaeon]
MSWAEGLPSAAAGVVASLVEGIFVYMYGAALGVIVGIFTTVTNAIASTIIAAINGFASLASLMGIFALPFMTIALVALASGLFLALDFVKDVPIVGAFA